MTTRIPVSTRLIDAITAHYAMNEDDIRLLMERITAQLITTYRRVILQQLQLYKCQKTPSNPIDPQSQQWVEAKALKDAKGIAATYERELRNKVSRLYQANRRGNRNYYISNLDRWITQRNSHKSSSISLNTMTAARKYAKDEFRSRNVRGGKYILVGPPPVCKLCIRIKGLGPVDLATTKRRPLPAHGGCPHDYEAVTLGKVDCETIWTG